MADDIKEAADRDKVRALATAGGRSASPAKPCKGTELYKRGQRDKEKRDRNKERKLEERKAEEMQARYATKKNDHFSSIIFHHSPTLNKKSEKMMVNRLPPPWLQAATESPTRVCTFFSPRF